MRQLFLALAQLAVAAPAWPCSTVGPLPRAEQVVRDAVVIARARAEGLSETPGRPGAMDGSPTKVRFVILEVVKGSLSSSTIEFNGILTDRDDPNDRPVPYDSVRPGGHGLCVALNYRAGAEYLLLLRRDEYSAQPNQLTPYWVTLGPTNEQLFDGVRDPWFIWVSRELRQR